MREGMWIEAPKGVGIVAELLGERVLVHYTGPAGQTVGAELVPFVQLKQARRGAIPACRRPKPDVAARFGYPA